MDEQCLECGVSLDALDAIEGRITCPKCDLREMRRSFFKCEICGGKLQTSAEYSRAVCDECFFEYGF